MVVIKDYKIPENCAECVILRCTIFGNDYCNATKRQLLPTEAEIKRANYCPLIEIPDNEVTKMTIFHKGDFPEAVEKEMARLPLLVDEAFRKQTNYIRKDDAIAVFGEVHPLDYNANTYLNKIKKLPCADVREVVYGRLDFCKSTNDLMCSNCLHYWIPNGDQYDYHYCPNCGARMKVV